MKKIFLILFLLPLFSMAQYVPTYDVPRIKTNRLTIPKDSSLYLGTSHLEYDNTSVNFSAPIKMAGSNAVYFNTTGYSIAGVSNLLIFNTPGSHLFRFAGTYKFQMNSGDFSPYTTLGSDLGRANARFGALFSRNVIDTVGVSYFDDNKSPSAALLHLNYSTNVLTIRGAEVNPMGTFTDNDTSPSVAGGNVWKYNGTANSVSIVSLDDHVVGAFYTIIGNSATYTITVVDGTPGGGDSFNLAGSNWVGGQDDVLVLYCYAADNFIEVSRSDN